MNTAETVKVRLILGYIDQAEIWVENPAKVNEGEDHRHKIVEIPAELARRAELVLREYDAVQEELAQYAGWSQ